METNTKKQETQNLDNSDFSLPGQTENDDDDIQEILSSQQLEEKSDLTIPATVEKREI